jgi:hypothetical protein
MKIFRVPFRLAVLNKYEAYVPANSIAEAEEKVLDGHPSIIIESLTGLNIKERQLEDVDTVELTPEEIKDREWEKYTS